MSKVNEIWMRILRHRTKIEKGQAKSPDQAKHPLDVGLTDAFSRVDLMKRKKWAIFTMLLSTTILGSSLDPFPAPELRFHGREWNLAARKMKTNNDNVGDDDVIDFIIARMKGSWRSYTASTDWKYKRSEERR